MASSGGLCSWNCSAWGTFLPPFPVCRINPTLLRPNAHVIRTKVSLEPCSIQVSVVQYLTSSILRCHPGRRKTRLCFSIYSPPTVTTRCRWKVTSLTSMKLFSKATRMLVSMLVRFFLLRFKPSAPNPGEFRALGLDAVESDERFSIRVKKIQGNTAELKDSHTEYIWIKLTKYLRLDVSATFVI